MALTVTHHTPGPPLEWESNQAAGQTAVAGARVNPGLAMKIVTLTFDASYDAGGELLAASAVEMSSITHVVAQSHSGYVFQWDQAAGKLLAYYGDWNNGSDGPLIEPTGVNLATVAPRCLVLGY